LLGTIDADRSGVVQGHKQGIRPLDAVGSSMRRKIFDPPQTVGAETATAAGVSAKCQQRTLFMDSLMFALGPKKDVPTNIQQVRD